jgi:hypothetical protein
VKLFVIALIAAISVGCAGCSLFYSTPKLIEEKPFYDRGGQLEFDYFHSPIGDVAGKYPKGWLQVNIEHIQELENVAFVYTDTSRTWVLTLEEIAGSADLRRRYELNGLLAIAEESINLHRTRTHNIAISRPPEVFKESRMRFANYEITRGSGDSLTHGRYVVFTTGIRYYELGIIELRPHPSSESYLSNYRLLQSVISSLEGVPTVKE